MDALDRAMVEAGAERRTCIAATDGADGVRDLPDYDDILVILLREDIVITERNARDGDTLW